MASSRSADTFPATFTGINKADAVGTASQKQNGNWRQKAQLSHTPVPDDKSFN